MIAPVLSLSAILLATGQVPTTTTATIGDDAFDAMLEGARPEPDDAFGRPALFIEAIEIVGNDKTDDTVILRRILLEVGDLVDADKVVESRLRLLSTGFFQSVEFSLRRGSQRGRALLVVEVVERNTILIDELYLGFSSVAPVFGGFGIVENNFFGRGVTAGAGFVVAGEDRWSLEVRFFLPDLSNTPLQLSGSAILLHGEELLDEENPDGEEVRYKRYGGTLGVGIGVAPSQRVSLVYRLESVSADRLPNLDPAILRGAPSIQFDDSVLSTLMLTYERDTRDDAFVPLQGHRVGLAVELGTSLIGSSYEFSKYTAEYQHAFTLFGTHSLIVNAFGGLIQGNTPFFNQFFISDYAYFAFGRDSLPRNNELNFSESNDYDDLIINAGLTYHVPLQSGGTLLIRTFFYGGVAVTATASLDELQEDPTGRGTGGHVPVSFDAGLKFDTFLGNFTVSVAYIVDLVL